MKKKYRIRKNSDFKKIIVEHQMFIKNNEFSIYSLRNNLNHARVGISVCLKKKSIIIRNKIKRQMRSMIHSLTNFFDLNFDFIIIIRDSFKTKTYQQNFCSLKESFKCLKLKI